MKLAFTIATNNFIAQAKNVGDSYLQHNPGDRFIVFVFDKVIEEKGFDPVEVVEISPDWIPHFGEKLTRYLLFELITSLKPSIAKYCLDHYPGVSSYIFLDCDILVYHAFDAVDAALGGGAEIIISPHFLTPAPKDGCFPDEKTYFNCGIYNIGFFAYSEGTQSRLFLDWWESRVEKECLLDFARGLFLEQIWLNLAPLYFDRCILMKHPGYNVAYWNFHERSLSLSGDGVYTINKNFPLVFFHFSGFNTSERDMISRFQNRYTFGQKPEWRPLFDEYADKLIGSPYTRYSSLQCYYASLCKQPKKRSWLRRSLSRIKYAIIKT